MAIGIRSFGSSRLACALLLGVLGVGVTSCLKPATEKKNVEGGPLTPTGPSGVTQNATGTFDSDCMNGNHDACIFYQNPVAQKGSAFATPVTNTTNLSAYQTYAVPITGLDSSGLLSNSHYQINPQSVPRVVKNAQGNWKYPYSNCSGGACTRDNVHRVSQLMAYYWLNYQRVFMTSQGGTFFVVNKGVSVDPFIPSYANAYWDSTNTEIALGEINSQDLALSAEVYLHENGHANVHYASMGNIEDPTALDIACDPMLTSACCSTNKGCPGGINEGLADYHAGAMFPSDTALGESIVNASGGFIECGLPRDIDLNGNLTAAAAYNACPASVRGEIHVIGRVYASMWWEVRKASSDKKEIDTLFTEHLRGLTATDDYETAAGKIIALDNTLFAGAHAAAITAEWNRRGLTPR